MSVFEIIRKLNLKRGIPARISAWLILLCISFGSLPASGHQRPKSANLVFCPIQKLWVQKYVPQIKVKAPLDDVCAASSEKSRFFFEMSKKMPLLRLVRDSGQTEKIFFNYLEKGNQAFAELSSSQNLPEPRLARLAAAEKSTGGSYKTDFDTTQTEIFTLAQAARPPTVQKSVSFETTTFRRLETISRRIRPRAPPASL